MASAETVARYIQVGDELASKGQFEKALQQFDLAAGQGAHNWKAWVGKGACELELGRFEEASRSFAQAAEANPTDHAAVILQSEVWRRAGAYDRELAVLQGFLERAPTDDEGLLRGARALHALKRDEEAVKWLQRLAAAQPRNPAAYTLHAEILRGGGKSAQALELLDKALAFNGKYAPALEARARILESRERFGEAAAAWQKLVDAAGPRPEFVLPLGLALEKVGEVESADRAYASALRLDPDAVGAWERVVARYALYTEERRQAEMHNLDAQLVTSPKDFVTLARKAIILRLLGRKREAAATLDRALMFHPYFVAAFLEHAQLADDAGDLGKAREWVERAMAQGKPSEPVLMREYSLLRRQGKVDQAQLALRKAVMLNPAREEAWFEAGLIPLIVGGDAEARRFFDEARARHPESYVVWFVDGLLKEKAGKFDEAHTAVDRAIALGGSSHQILAAKTRFCYGERKYEDAVDWATLALSAGSTPEVMYLKGRSLFELKRLKEARPFFERVLEVTPRNIDAWCCLGDCRFAANDNAGALECYEKALALDDNNREAWRAKGLLQYSLKKYDGALQSLAYALDVMENDPEIWAVEGNIYAEMQLYPLAEKALDRALEFRPDWPLGHINKGNLYAKMGQLKAAVTCYERTLALEPGNEVARKNREIALEDMHDYAPLADSYRLRLDKNPLDRRALVGRANALLQMGSTDASLELAERALTVAPDATAYQLKARALQLKGEFGGAMEAYGEALAAEPRRHEAWNNLGSVLYTMRYYGHAQSCFDKAVKLEPQGARSWANLGNVQFVLSDFTNAARSFRKSVNLDEKDAGVWNNLGNAEAALGTFEAAVASYKRAISLDEKMVQAWLAMGFALFRSNEMTVAMEAYDRALVLSPGNFQALLGKANVASAQGDFKRGVELYDLAVAADPGSAIAWNNRGYALTKRGMLNLALNCFTKAIDLDPKYAEAWKNKGNVYASLKKSETALICLNTSLKINPNDIEALTSKGALLAQKGDVQKAKEVLEQAARAQPGNAAVLVNLGLMQVKSGEAAKAIESFATALKLEPAEPTALFNIAAAHEKLLNHRAAWGYVQEYRALDPEDEEAVALAVKVAEALGYNREAEKIRKEVADRKASAALNQPKIEEKPEHEPPGEPEAEQDKEPD